MLRIGKLEFFTADNDYEWPEKIPASSQIAPAEFNDISEEFFFDSDSADLSFNREFEFNVSRYSTAALTKAEHTDELKADGNIHLRIDYKVSGIGSNSCGPELEKRYRLDEKRIAFAFSVQPVREG